jgi:hypothetical protein
MPARDTYHDCVRTALVKDGWTITHDPYTMSFGLRAVYADLGAERVLAAEKGAERIVVEIKSFRGGSELREFELAVGQYAVYRSVLDRTDPSRRLFLAIPTSVFDNLLQDPIAQPVVQDLAIALVVFDPIQEEIVRWSK